MGVIEEGKNAWRIARSDRVAFLVDGEAYFEAIAEAFEKARRSIYILGWDFNSNVVLQRNGRGSPATTLKDLLQARLDAQADLHVYVLIWDFSVLYAFERDLLPLLDIAWSGGPRLHFQMDDRHPVGGCHHQKIVVVDDSVAFVGGFDLTKCRWDTPSHEMTDPRRVDANGEPYPPFHDVQMLVDGGAARALGDLARERWSRASALSIVEPKDRTRDAWPSSVEPAIQAVDVAIARTVPALDGVSEIREIERLYLDAIAAAQHFIYLESQYFTSSKIVDALVERLTGREGPEVVAVFPQECSGWLEKSTMGTLRNRALQRLRSTKAAERFRAHCPTLAGSGQVFVHSKLLIVDDEILTIGSANLSNRSMGMDSECNLAMEHRDGDKASDAIADLRERLLAEHLGVSKKEVAERLGHTRSLVKTVESLQTKERTLMPIEIEGSEWSEPLAESVSAADPERPVRAEELVERFVSMPEDEESRRPMARFGLMLLALAALAVLWRWTPLGEVVDSATLTDWMTRVTASEMTPLLVVVGYVAASLLMIPMTLLIVVTALVFDPLPAMSYALLGSMLSAAAGFAVGHLLGRETIRRLAGARLNRVSRRLARSGLVAMTAARLLPLGPFTIVNLIAGASHIRFRDFMLGSFLGLLPGICAVTILKDRLASLVREPTFDNVALLLAFAVVVVVGTVWMRRRLGAARPEQTDE